MAARCGWRPLLALATVAALAGCATRTPPLYLWESFPRQQYSALLGQGTSPAEQIQALEAHAEKARAAQAALPPGLRAHLGMVYLGAGNPQRSKELWLAEKAAFPESAPYMDRLLKRLEGPSSADSAVPGLLRAKSETPA